MQPKRHHYGKNSFIELCWRSRAIEITDNKAYTTSQDLSDGKLACVGWNRKVLHSFEHYEFRRALQVYDDMVLLTKMGHEPFRMTSVSDSLPSQPHISQIPVLMVLQ